MNPQGIRSAQCAFFDVMHKPRPGPSLNISLVQRVLLNCYLFKLGVEEFVRVCCSDLQYIYLLTSNCFVNTVKPL